MIPKNTWPKSFKISSILKNKEKYIVTIATCHREINEKACMIRIAMSIDKLIMMNLHN